MWLLALFQDYNTRAGVCVYYNGIQGRGGELCGGSYTFEGQKV